MFVDLQHIYMYPVPANIPLQPIQYIYIYMYIYICKHICIRIRYICNYTCVNIYICVYIYIFIHMYHQPRRAPQAHVALVREFLEGRGVHNDPSTSHPSQTGHPGNKVGSRIQCTSRQA